MVSQKTACGSCKGGGGAEICPYQRQKEEQIKPKTRVRSLKLVRKKKLFYKSRDNAKNDNAKKKHAEKVKNRTDNQRRQALQ